MYTLVDAELEAQLADEAARRRWLVLDRHPDFQGHWVVEGFNKDYLYDLMDIIGSYRALAPAGLERFLDMANELEYQVAFFDDPADVLRDYERLNGTPEVIINSSFVNTVNGMLPFQVQGYNMLKDLEYGVARWDTGTGKTVLASALVAYHQLYSDFEICFFVVKKHNKVNTVRKLLKLAEVPSLYIAGPKNKREQLYWELGHWLHKGARGMVVVMNYEQLKNDFVCRDEEGKLALTKWGEEFFPGRDLMIVWDEMPTKLKTRTSELYKSICKLLYRTDPPQVNWTRLRPRSLRSYMLSATPIENSPEDWFNCVRLLDGGRTYGTVSDFHDAYVCGWSDYDPTKPEDFHNFERMRLKTAHFVHQASKSDPDIAAVFPSVAEELVYIDWDERNAAVYNEIQRLADKAARDTEEKDMPIFSLIGLFQMLCDAPEMINDSAARREVFEEALEDWELSPVGRPPRKDGSEVALQLSEKLTGKLTNHNHPKIEKLREILVDRHPNDQVAIYTRFNEALMPYLEAVLQEWAIPYVRYSGTERQQQAAQDAFQDGKVRVFLSSDKGSDSIDLDRGKVVIDYNLPWKWTTLTQRHNRVHRATSEFDCVYYYTLMMADSVEERVLEIIEKKRGYHNELFDPAAGDFSASARFTKEDLMYVLTGRRAVG